MVHKGFENYLCLVVLKGRFHFWLSVASSSFSSKGLPDALRVLIVVLVERTVHVFYIIAQIK